MSPSWLLRGSHSRSPTAWCPTSVYRVASEACARRPRDHGQAIGERRVEALGALASGAPRRRRRGGVRNRGRDARALQPRRSVRDALPGCAGHTRFSLGTPVSHGTGPSVRRAWSLVVSTMPTSSHRRYVRADERVASGDRCLAGALAACPSGSLARPATHRGGGPIRSNVAHQLAGVLVAGVSPDTFWTRNTRASSSLSPGKSPRPLRTRAPMRRSADGRDRSRNSTAPRPPSSPMFRTSSGRP